MPVAPTKTSPSGLRPLGAGPRAPPGATTGRGHAGREARPQTPLGSGCLAHQNALPGEMWPGPCTSRGSGPET
eukprot:10442271-Lingulodinium_polyedra.AAC.1